MNERADLPVNVMLSMPAWSYQLKRDSKLSIRTRKHLEVKLITNALRDETFRRELLASPKRLIERELGTELPESIEYRVLEENEKTLYFVLPANPYVGLAEVDLQAVVGFGLEDVAQWALDMQSNALSNDKNCTLMLARAWRDHSFKQALLLDSKAVVGRELNLRLPDETEIRILEETANILYLVLPMVVDELHFLTELEIEEFTLEIAQACSLVRTCTLSSCGCTLP